VYKEYNTLNRMENDIKNESPLILTHAPITNLFWDSSDNYENLIKSLKTYKYLKEKDSWGLTLLHHTVKRGLLRESEIMLDHGIDINSQDQRGCTALHMAAEFGYYHVIKLLLDMGADPTIKDNYKCYPIVYATFNSPIYFSYSGVVIDRLKSYKLLINNTQLDSEYLHNELIFCSNMGYDDYIKAVLEKMRSIDMAININFIAKNGKNAIMMASDNGHTHTVEFLLSLGAQEGF
jgi:ankyrin repeat protein